MPPATDPPADAPVEVTACCFPLAVPAVALPAMEATLSPDERARAARFYFDRHRRQFIAARGGLRRVLSGLLGVPATQLAFTYGPHGKPRVDSPPQPGFFFNLSHAGEWALLAWTGAGEIGADIERLRPVTPGLAERFFAPAEAAALAAQPEAERAAAFFRCWTRKEAYLKALGSGLAQPLDGFVVSLAAGEPAALREVLGAPHEARHWRLEHLVPVPGYCGAIALRRPEWRLRWLGAAP
ncbi:MAG: 4'-phosphopantetheinyl transferase family protein [Terriglobales bacterium]